MHSEGFYWVALIGTDDFEPGKIEFTNGKPECVWLIGNDTPFGAHRCIIAEKIERSK